MNNEMGKYIGTVIETSYSIGSGDDGKIVVKERLYDVFVPGDFGYDKIEPIIL